MPQSRSDPLDPAPAPWISIVMPVFNTGRILLESVRSVLAQRLFASESAASWELLIVDDRSSDAQTLEALVEAQAMSTRVRIIVNRGNKGVAGARNAGIHAATGQWIGFLDSDDLWFPDFLSAQRETMGAFPEAEWFAAQFFVGDDAAIPKIAPLSVRAPCLYRYLEKDYQDGRVSRLPRPVDILLECGCIQVMTVQVRRTTLLAMGGFDESMPSAEDYDLWLRLAVEHDLYMAPRDAGIYRVRAGSLTKSGRPMYYCEDRMLHAARRKVSFARHRRAIDARLQLVYTRFCFHYRATGEFARAATYALALVRIFPTRAAGWRYLLAAALRRP